MIAALALAASIGVGTGTGTSAPYIGASAATTRDPDSPGVFAYPAIPQAAGTRATYSILVLNAGTGPESITLGTTGGAVLKAATLADGATLYGAAWTSPASAAQAWLSFSVPVVNLNAGQETRVQVTVTVPKGTRAGTYYATATATATSTGVGIKAAVSSGVRAFITVR